MRAMLLKRNRQCGNAAGGKRESSRGASSKVKCDAGIWFKMGCLDSQGKVRGKLIAPFASTSVDAGEFFLFRCGCFFDVFGHVILLRNCAVLTFIVTDFYTS